jgi:hypothetical protein
MLATTTRKGAGKRRVLLSRNALDRNHLSLARLASASSHGVRPLSENCTPSTLLVRVRKFTCANVLILCPDIAHESYRVGRSIGAVERFWPAAARCPVSTRCRRTPLSALGKLTLAKNAAGSVDRSSRPGNSKITHRLLLGGAPAGLVPVVSILAFQPGVQRFKILEQRRCIEPIRAGHLLERQLPGL